MMVALYCGTSNIDITNIDAFLGIPRSKLWERYASTHTEQVNKHITSIVYTMVEKSLKKEIEMIIRAILLEEKCNKRKI